MMKASTRSARVALGKELIFDAAFCRRPNTQTMKIGAVLQAFGIFGPKRVLMNALFRGTTLGTQ